MRRRLLAVPQHGVRGGRDAERAHQLLRVRLRALEPGRLGAGAERGDARRGELVDEAVLVQALRSGRLGGFAADVYEGEFEHDPPAELLAFDNVILTPHTSGQAEHRSSESLEIFKENLRRLLAGQPLLNQVDWQRGY